MNEAELRGRRLFLVEPEATALDLFAVTRVAVSLEKRPDIARIVRLFLSLKTEERGKRYDGGRSIFKA